MVKLFSLKSPDEWATTKQACRDTYVVTCFLPSTIRILALLYVLSTVLRISSSNLLIIYYIRVSKGLGLQGSGPKIAGLRVSGLKLTGPQGSPEIDQGLQVTLCFFALIQKQIPELRKYSNVCFLNAVFIRYSPLYSCFTVI